MLNSLELTGRARTHVREDAGLNCTLHEAALVQVRVMTQAALDAGIELAVVSGFRDFERQTLIWNSKFRGERVLLDRSGVPIDGAALSDFERIDAILLWSALPGASRHHWGTDIDVIDRLAILPEQRPRLTREEFGENGPFALLNEWLDRNMSRYGFFRPYSTDRGGVQPEPWHLSYAPIAVPALNAFSLDVLFEAISGSAILGREHVLARLGELYGRYVASIDPPA
jgi:LAS superfamily LD-carboxypeptidase LdcB